MDVLFLGHFGRYQSTPAGTVFLPVLDIPAAARALLDNPATRPFSRRRAQRVLDNPPCVLEHANKIIQTTPPLIMNWAIYELAGLNKPVAN